MSWEDSDALANRLNRSLNAFNWKDAEDICKQIISRIKTDSALFPESLAKKLLSSLRRKRRFELVTQLAEALLQSGLRTPLIRRQYAQALIDQGVLAAAETLLEVSLAQADIDKTELTEAHGLLGRIYKQIYVNNENPKSPQNPLNLERALKEYFETYNIDRQNNFWHGINVVALVFRAQRDHHPVLSHWTDPVALADEILATLKERERKKNGAQDAWELATRMEAYVALGKNGEAAETALKYIAREDADAFELRSTIRQFTEVWQLNEQEPPGNNLLPILKAGHLRKEGATAGTDFTNVITQAVAASEAAKDCSAIGGEDAAGPLRWYKVALDQCESIASIETVSGKWLGTGWLVNASDFFANRTGVLLLTNEHVISNDKSSPGISPEEAQANFQSRAQTFKLKEIVWSSPSADLDATFVALEGEPDIAPLRLDSKSTFEPSTRLYVISVGTADVTTPTSSNGAPRVAVQDTYLLGQNESVLHYRTPEQVITSGSPVFEPEDWHVIALHHASAEVMPRIDGREGTYEASEGISIAAIKRAIDASLDLRPRVKDTRKRARRALDQQGESAKASFRITLEGEAASETEVQHGTEVDLVFEYVPPPEVELTLDIERTRKLQVPLGIMVVPVGFKFTAPDESGYRHVRFYQGSGNEKVRFRLRASRESLGTEPVEDRPSPESGFHIIFDLRGSVLRQLFVPARLVKERPAVKRSAEAPVLHTFDLKELKQFDEQTVQAQERVAVELQKVLA